MKTRLKLLLILFILPPVFAVAQDNLKTQDLNTKGQEYLIENNYEKAIKTFQKVLDLDNENAIAFRSLAYAYELSSEYELSDAMYSKYISVHPMESKLVYFEAAKIKYLIGDYKSALSLLNTFDNLKDQPSYEFGVAFDQEKEQELKARLELDALSTQIQMAVDIQQFSTMNDVTNIGRQINTPADEYFPYLTNDRELIFYTRRKDKFGDENLFFSEKVNQQWNLGKSVGIEFNSNNNEGMSTILRNGRRLFFTACERPNVKGTCDIWTAELNGHKISNMEAIVGETNSDYWESQASISCDGDQIYFASNRPGGMGGSDIWTSRLQEDGTWSDPINLGPEINTALDEEAPFISNDSRTLFFSSTGHPGLGEQDMFLSKMDESNNWQKPVNLGPPINSSFRELGFYLSSNGTTGYFASDREHPQAVGGMDIYSFELPEILNADPVTYLELTVIDSISKNPVIGSVFTEEEGRLQTDDNGRIFICSPSNTELNLTIIEPGYNALTKTISIPEWDNSIMYSVLLPLKPLGGYSDTEILSFAPDEDNIVEVDHMVYFGFNKKKIDGLEKQNLGDFLNGLPDKDKLIEIEIKGFSDQTGNDLYNMKLSEDRANEVAVYLKNRGYRVDRVFIEGGGELNDDIPDREKRRVEIKIYHK
jgi:hypothetical protein